MTQKLHHREVELFRALKKTAIVLMLLFRLDEPVGESDIASILDIHPATIRTYLRSLVRLGVITRTHRFSGWALTTGGRQMILGESTHEESAEPELLEPGENIKTSAKISRSLPAAALSLSFKKDKEEAAAASSGTSAKNPPSSAEISRSPGGHQAQTTAAEDQTAELESSRLLQAKPALAAAGKVELVRANLEAFASIGLARNEYVSEICQLEHVTPTYILGQKKRLESERRYFHGLF